MYYYHHLYKIIYIEDVISKNGCQAIIPLS